MAVLLRDRFWDKCNLVSSLLMGELALSADSWMIPAFREGVDMPEGRAVAQRDKGWRNAFPGVSPSSARTSEKSWTCWR